MNTISQALKSPRLFRAALLIVLMARMALVACQCCACTLVSQALDESNGLVSRFANRAVGALADLLLVNVIILRDLALTNTSFRRSSALRIQA